jgi:MFS family permease
VLLAAGVWLRGHDLAATPTTGDEAESAINALTILQTGLPRGEYLGLPIYENTLIEPWPGNEEYEFRDSSYSNKGLAIYHGWLPLYAMAGSMKAFGVGPDPTPAPDEALKVRHDSDQIRRRVIAARFPAILFGAGFMLLLFFSGRELFGTDAGLAALAVGAFGRPFVYMGREARYHSATLMLTTACCWLVWRAFRYARWRDFVWLAVAMVLLFYTHLLGFMIATVMMTAVAIALLYRDRTSLPKLLACGAIIAVSCGPWILLSGILSQTTHLPPARLFLSFPADLIYYPLLRMPFLVFPVLGLLWLIVAWIFHHRLPETVTRPLARHRRQIAYLLGWVVVGIVLFTLLIPAASYFYKRLTLAVMGPGVLWGALVIAAAARAWLAKGSVIVAPLAFLAIVTVGNMAHLWFLEAPDRTETYEFIDHLRTVKIEPGTKLYCTPNHQLALTYLAGLPVQSVAPVRKSFFDSYPGPMLIVDSAPPCVPLSVYEVRRVATEQAPTIAPPSDAELAALAQEVACVVVREKLHGKVASIEPPPPPLPPYGKKLLELQRKELERELDEFQSRGANNPMLRGYPLRDWSDWWPLFFYRCVEPRSRMGDNLSYANRLRSATAEVLPSGWVLYHCPPLR